MYDAFELQMYGVDEISNEAEPLFLDDPTPEDLTDPYFLYAQGVTKIFWAVLGHLDEGGAEFLFQSDDYEHIKKQYDFFVALLENQNG